jgi:hypothetical protein
MNQTMKIVLFVLAGLLIVAASVFAGFFFSQRQNALANFGYGYNANDGYGMPFFNRFFGSRGFGGMMGGYGYNRSGSSNSYFGQYGGQKNDQYGGRYGMGPGMMGGYGYSSGTSAVTTLTLDSARSAVQDYLNAYDNDDLEIKEVMLFSQNAYAIVSEKSTGMGAMELLVDPSTLNVYPEYGPNRMWNLKYGMMGTGGCGFGNGSGVCGQGLAQSDANAASENSISMDKAATIANQYLATNMNGAVVSQPGTAFYGYFTFDYTQNDKIAGMLSVNGSSGQVWLHTWHGQFIDEMEMDEVQ